MAGLPEALLQYAWQTRQYDSTALRCVDGRRVRIEAPGTLNPDQGPDFLHARLGLDGLTFHGHVEVHVDGQDWYAHGHHTDPGFRGVILHVVAQPGRTPPRTAGGAPIPELVIGHCLAPGLLHRWEALRANPEPFPCANQASGVPALHRNQWVALMGWERIIGKVEALEAELANAGYDWQELIWQQLAGALGGPVNKAAFVELARRAGARLMGQYRGEPERQEALLFGTAGFLNEPGPADAYLCELAEAWAHLSHKHRLQPMAPGQFRFARLRPNNFPTLRIAQLAAFAHLMPDLMRFAGRPWEFADEARLILPSAYWLTHYRFGAAGTPRKKALGKQFVQTLLINCFVPIAVLYHRTLGHKDAVDDILNYLQRLPPENNRHVRTYRAYGFPTAHALDTQGILHLQRHYCQPRQCLRCGIGHQLLKQRPGDA